MLEPEELLNKIKFKYINFNEQEFLNFVKLHIKELYKALKENNDNKVFNVNKNVIEKIKENPLEYRISPNIDTINVQFVKIYDYMEEENIIKIYASIYFYDNTKNNENWDSRDMYWNDIWIISYDGDKLFECENCGASMRYDQEKELYICDYCRDTKPKFVFEQKWNITDIEVMK